MRQCLIITTLSQNIKSQTIKCEGVGEEDRKREREGDIYKGKAYNKYHNNDIHNKIPKKVINNGRNEGIVITLEEEYQKERARRHIYIYIYI